VPPTAYASAKEVARLTGCALEFTVKETSTTGLRSDARVNVAVTAWSSPPKVMAGAAPQLYTAGQRPGTL